MYKKMLIPLDGSEVAEIVFVYAKELAARHGIDIFVLQVCSPQEHELDPMHRAYVERAVETIRQQSEEVQKRTGIQYGKAIETRGELTFGDPAEEILRYVDENGIDLILMATHGRSGLKRWVMGSVADKVLRASNVPVWLVRAGTAEEIVYDQWPQRTMLVSLDGSDVAEAVLPHVEAIAKQWDAEPADVVLLRICELQVLPPDYPVNRLSVWEKHAEQEMARCKRIAEQYLAEKEKHLNDIGIKVRSEVLTGKPAEEIIDCANRNPFSIIFMATHGRSGLSRWAYGSVTEKVLQGVSSPLLLVRPQ